MGRNSKAKWTTVQFCDFAENITVRVNPAKVQHDIYVGLEHLDPDSLHLSQWGHPSDVIGQKLAFKKGDVIFGRRRAYQRKLAVAEFNGICSAHAMVIRAKPELALPEFLPFFMKSDIFMEHAIKISVGSLSPTISWRTLGAQAFPLPSLDIQKEIAEVLWAVDSVIETYNSVKSNIEKAISVYCSKNFLLHEARRENPNIPSRWKVGYISEIASINPSMPKGLPDDLEVSFVPMENLAEGGGILCQHSKNLGEVRKGYIYFEEKDILFAKITSCMENGKGALAQSLINGKAMGSTEYHVLRAFEPSDTHFLYHLTMSKALRNRAERWMQGTAGQRRVPKDFFSRRPIVIPDPESRVRIGATLDALQVEKRKVRSHIEAIKAFSSAYLHNTLNQKGRITHGL